MTSSSPVNGSKNSSNNTCNTTETCSGFSSGRLNARLHAHHTYPPPRVCGHTNAHTHRRAQVRLPPQEQRRCGRASAQRLFYRFIRYVLRVFKRTPPDTKHALIRYHSLLRLATLVKKLSSLLNIYLKRCVCCNKIIISFSACE